ncbi:tuftelin 1a [Denticeps clupeoides]|uniref:Tuftelin n=1 Tax=Denticeps clupeoides TaxID=299321 RepID=A0AAY4AK68_9TELE|nr:tuftelin [Denticeps clupeoides]
MNGVTRSLCTFEDLRTEDRLERCRRLRLTLHDQNQQHNSKPIGRAFALVQPSSDRPSVREEPAKAADEKVEVIKVYLKAREQQQAKHQQNLKMLSEEVSQIQEVRYSLKNLREQMAAKNNSYRTESRIQLSNGVRVSAQSTSSSSSPTARQNGEEKLDWADDQERTRMREVSKRLYAQLQEAEKKHQEEREKMQAEAGQYRQQLAEQNDQLKKAEVNAEKHTQEIAELQRLLNGMEQESSALREQLMKREAQLMQLRERKEEREDEEMRSEELQKENAILKEKLHHLDDMLRSQQRKLRTMIEQVQNSKLVIQERDRVIRELEERVAFLEAENREMHDQMDYFLGGQRTNSYLSADPNARIVYSKPLKQSTQGNKPLPLIKVIEIKS